MALSNGVFVLSILTLYTSLAFAQFLPPTFSRWIWQSSVVAGHRLYIDGGEVYALSPTVAGAAGAAWSSTLSIDLTTSWNNATVKPIVISKPSEFPVARQPSLWYNPNVKVISMLGGWEYTTLDFGGQSYPSDGGPVTIRAIQAPQIQWNFDVSTRVRNGDMWKRAANQPPNDIAKTGHGAISVSTANEHYILGGADVVTSQFTWARPGIAKVDFSSKSWSNNSADGYGGSEAGLGWFGESVFAQMFGEQGVLIFIGGWVPKTQAFTTAPGGTPLLDMSLVTIYDIASGKFVTQTAGGIVPPGRWAFCAIGAADSSNKTFDIYIHGGNPGGESNNPYSEDYANIFVLSLPSFTWHRIDNSTASMRSSHTCSLLGNHQMVVIGGHDSSKDSIASVPDPWTNGIGIYDINKLEWAASYDAEAYNADAAYVRPAMLNTPENDATPVTWDNDLSATLFGKARTVVVSPGSTSSSNPESSLSPSSSTSGSGTNVGAIAGGVAGIIAVLALIGGFLIWRRRRRQSKADSEEKAELSGTPRYFVVPVELEVPPAELDSNPSVARRTYQLKNTPGVVVNTSRVG